MRSNAESRAGVPFEAVTHRNTLEALLAMAAADEAAEYLVEYNLPLVRDNYGGFTRTGPRLEGELLDRLIEKLRKGEWIALGFGFEQGQPHQLSPLLWDTLKIDVPGNRAYDPSAMVGYKGIGHFHSLAFIAPRQDHQVVGHSQRAATVAAIKLEIECLDESLPLTISKSRFLEQVRVRFPCVPTAQLKSAWAKAKLRPERRSPGLKSNQSDKSQTD